MLLAIKMQHNKGLKMNQNDYLLSTDYDENDHQYYYIYNWQTLEFIKRFDNLDSAQSYFDAIGT